MSPLVRPDPEPVEEEENIDQRVLEKTENFWSVLKSAFGVVGRLAHAKPPRFLKQGVEAVMKGDGTGFYGRKTWSSEVRKKRRK